MNLNHFKNSILQNTTIAKYISSDSGNLFSRGVFSNVTNSTFKKNTLVGFAKAAAQTELVNKLLPTISFLDISLAKIPKKPMLFSVTGSQSQIQPIQLYINPQTISHAYSQIKNTKRTIGGFVEYYWGENLDTISCSSNTGIFVSKINGLTVEKRRRTEAFNTFKHLLDIYKNNACTYDNDGIIRSVGNVQIEYDGETFSGHFTDFKYDETADRPFEMTFEFTFKVERTFGDTILYGNNFIRRA